MATIRIAEPPVFEPRCLTPEELRVLMPAALDTAIHMHRRDFEEFREADASGALRRFDDLDLSLVDIMWRCWIAAQRFSGAEHDVIRTRDAAYAIVAPEDGPDRRDDVRLAVLQWADPTYAGALVQAPAGSGDEEPDGADMSREQSGLPWPWHHREPAPFRIRNALGPDDQRALELLAAAAERGDELPGVSTLLAGMDLDTHAPVPPNAAVTDNVRHMQRLIAAFLRMAKGDVVDPADELAVTLADLPPRHRDVVLRRIGAASGTPESLRDIAESLGVSRERVRQVMEAAIAKCQLCHPLLPISMAVWRAYPQHRVATTLNDWWEALPLQIRPATANGLVVLRAVEQWYWLPLAAWVEYGGTWIVSADGLSESALGEAVSSAERTLRTFRRWGAVSIRDLAQAAGVHADVAQCVLAAGAGWELVTKDWFLYTGGDTLLGTLLVRWKNVRPRIRRRRLKALVRRRQTAGKPGAAPPRAVQVKLARLQRVVRQRHEPTVTATPAKGIAAADGMPGDGMPADGMPANRGREDGGRESSLTIQPTSVDMPNSISADGVGLTGAQARYIVDRLVREGRLSDSDVARYLAMMAEEIHALERRLAMLRGVDKGSEFAAAGTGEGSAPAPIAPGRPADDVRLYASDVPTRTYASTPSLPDAPSSTRAGLNPIAERGGVAPGESEDPPRAGNGRRRRRPMVLKPETLESRRQQGHYLNLIRQVPADTRELYKEMARELGRDVAIKAMQEALGVTG